MLAPHLEKFVYKSRLFSTGFLRPQRIAGLFFFFMFVCFLPHNFQLPKQQITWIRHVYWNVLHMKSLNSKTDISIFINMRYLRLKLLQNKENNKKICHIFHHNFKNIPCYVMSEVSLKRFYFALFDDGLTLKTLKLTFISFWIQTLHIFFVSL